MTPAPRSVDRIVFRWDPDGASGAPGLTPVAFSCSQELARQLFHGLGPVVRTEGRRGRAGVARLKWHGRTVLLRRDPARDPSGRPNTVSSVLLATPDVPGPEVLSPEVCLAMLHRDWERLTGPVAEASGVLRRLDEADLRRLVATATPGFDRAITEVAGPLAAAVAAMVRFPDRRLSILDRSQGSDPPPILWGLRQLLGDRMGEQTFSTHETADSQPFRVAFVPEWPASAAYDPDRCNLDLETVHTDRAQAVATCLVGSYQRDPAAYRSRLGRLPALAGLTLEERLRQLDKLGLPDSWGSAARPRPHPRPQPAEPWWVPPPFPAVPEPVPAARPATPGMIVDGPPDRAAAREPHDFDPYVPPSVGPLRWVAGRVRRWLRPLPTTTQTEERKALKELRRLTERNHSSRKDPDVAEQLGRLDSRSLLSGLAHDDTTYPLARLLLAELANRSPYWSAAEADKVCATVVTQRLYLDHLIRWRAAAPRPGPGGASGAATAEPDRERVALPMGVFDWAVRPRLRRRLRRGRAAALIERLIQDLLADVGQDGKRVAVALALDERPLPLTQAAWRSLLAQVLPPPLRPQGDAEGRSR